jgi:hypothetical protein
MSYDTYFTVLKMTAIADDKVHKRTNKTKLSDNAHSHNGRSKNESGIKSSSDDLKDAKPDKIIHLPKDQFSKLSSEDRLKIITHNKNVKESKGGSANPSPQVYDPGSTHPNNDASSSIFVPKGLWDQLPPEAQKAIRTKRYNNNRTHNANSASQSHVQPNGGSSPPSNGSPPPGGNTIQQPPLAQQSSGTDILNHIMSNSLAQNIDTVTINRQVYTRSHTSNVHKLKYSFSIGTHSNHPKLRSLIDGGANGGFAGADVAVLDWTEEKADVSGIDDNIVENVPICTVDGIVQTTRGNVIAVMHQYAYHGGVEPSILLDRWNGLVIRLMIDLSN